MERDAGRYVGVNLDELFRRVVEDEEDDLLHSVEYYHLEFEGTLNLNGTFRSYSATARRKALAEVFRLVNSLPIEILLLQGNNIDDYSWGGGLDDVIHNGISELPNIKTLDLSGNNIRREWQRVGSVDCTQCGIFPGLLSLSLSRNPIDMQRYPLSLEVLPSLETLHLNSILSLSTSLFLILEKSTSNLQEIDLSNNSWGNDLFDAFTKYKWRHLRNLTLSNTLMTSENCACLGKAIKCGKFKALESIDLSHNMLYSMVFKPRGQITLTSSFKRTYLPKLREIRLGVTALRDPAVSKMAKAITAGDLRSLEILDLSCCLRLTDSSIASLVTSFCSGLVPLIKELNFESSAFGNGSAVELAKAIKCGHLRFLEKLDLSGNGGMTDKALISMAASFEGGQTTQLRELLLNNVEMGDDGAKLLADAISSGNLRALQKLNLSHNLISKESVRYLVDSLASGQARDLRELGLQCSGLGDECIAELIKIIDSENLSFLENVQLCRVPCGNTRTIEGRKVSQLKIFTDLPEIWEPLSKTRAKSMEGSMEEEGNEHVEFLMEMEKSNAVEGPSEEEMGGELDLLSRFKDDKTQVVDKEFSGQGRLDSSQLAGESELFHFKNLSFKEDHEEENVSEVSEAWEQVKQRQVTWDQVNTTEGSKTWEQVRHKQEDVIKENCRWKQVKQEQEDVIGESWKWNQVQQEKVRSEQVKVEKVEPEDMKAEQVKTEQVKAEQVKIEQVKAEQVKTEQVKAEQVKAEQVKAEQVKAEEVKAEQVKAGHVEPGHEGQGGFFGQKRGQKNFRPEEAGQKGFPEIAKVRKIQSQRHAFSDGQTCFVPTSERKGDDSITSSKQKETLEQNEHMEWELESSQQLKIQAETSSVGAIQFERCEPRSKSSPPGNKSFVEDHRQWNDDTEFARRSAGILPNSGIINVELPREEYECRKREFQIRPDVQNLGFTSWDQEFSPNKMLLLCNLKSLEQEVHILFFHKQAMASVFGLGIAFSRLSIFFSEQAEYEIWIEEIMEATWKGYWGSSCESTWKPALFERRDDILMSAKTNVLSLSRDRALLKFGICVDGVEDQEFLHLNSSASQILEDVSVQPKWISLLTDLVHYMLHGKEDHGTELNGRDDEQMRWERLLHQLCHPARGTSGEYCHDGKNGTLLCDNEGGVLNSQDNGDQSFHGVRDGSACDLLHAAPHSVDSSYIKIPSEANLTCDQSGSKSSDGSEAHGTGDGQTLRGSREGCDQSHSRKRKHTPEGNHSSDGKAAPRCDVKGKASKREKKLIVNVVFAQPGCNLYRCDSSGVLAPSAAPADAPAGMPYSSIKPTFIVEFMYDPGGTNRLKTTLGSEYQFDSEDRGSQVGWYQNEFELSFRHSMAGQSDAHPVCCLDSHYIISNVVHGESENTRQSGQAHSELVESSAGLKIGWTALNNLVPGLSGNRKTEKSMQSSYSNQDVNKADTRRLDDNRTIAIRPANRNGTLAYKLHSLLSPAMPENPQWQDIKATGRYSNCEVKVEGVWDVWGGENEAYDFSAEKSLSRYFGGATAASNGNASSGHRASPAGNGRLPGRGDEAAHTFRQIFTRRFILNHNFSEFFELRKKEDPYKWVLYDLSNRNNHVPEAIKLSVPVPANASPSASQAFAPDSVSPLLDQAAAPVSPSPQGNEAPVPASELPPANQSTASASGS